METKAKKLVFDILRNHFAQDDLVLETKLVDDLAADSLDYLELVMDIEDDFEINITDKQLADFKTVGDIVTHVNRARPDDDPFWKNTNTDF